MATTTKITVSLSNDALWLAQKAAERSDMTLSAWLSRAASHYALWQYPPQATSEDAQQEDERERAAEDAA